MSLYRYASPSLLDEVVFVKTEQGGLRGYLHTDNADASKLAALLASFDQKDMTTVPFTLEGRPMLEVRGLSNEHQLLKLLKQAGAVSGEGKKEETQDEKIPLLDKLKKRTLQASGAFYLVGDACYTYYGYKKAHWEDIAAGLSYFAGTGSLLAFGKNDQSDIQVRDIARKLKKFFDTEHVKLPDSCSLENITKDRNTGVLGTVTEFCQRYPSELMNVFYGLAGTFIATSAFRHRVNGKVLAGMDAHAIKEMRSEGLWDMGLGLMTLASGAASILIKEKKPDPDDPPPKNALEKAWAWVQEKPLRVAGYGYIASTLCHAVSTYKAMKEANRVGDKATMGTVGFRAAFVGANLVAEALLAISSKGHGEGVLTDDSVKDSVYSLVAELILKQSEKDRAYLIPHVAGFLQQPDVLADSFEHAEAEINRHIGMLEKNPWVCLKQVQKSAPEKPAENHATPTPTTRVHPGAIAGNLRAGMPALRT